MKPEAKLYYAITGEEKMGTGTGVMIPETFGDDGSIAAGVVFAKDTVGNLAVVLDRDGFGFTPLDYKAQWKVFTDIPRGASLYTDPALFASPFDISGFLAEAWRYRKELYDKMQAEAAQNG